MSLRHLLCIVVAAVVAVFSLANQAQAQGSDVIRGRVVGPDSVPVEGARVTITSVVSQISRPLRTDRNGRFTMIFPGGDGHYIVSISQLGFIVRTFELKRTVDQDVLIADATLQRPQMDAVVVSADVRGQIPRGTGTPDVAGTEQNIALGLMQQDMGGSLAALASLIPGVLTIPGSDGFSVLGLDPTDNTITVNGMTFDGSSLPRDAIGSTSLNTSPYDVSRGGFSGGNLNVRTVGGGNWLVRGASLQMNLPQLMFTDQPTAAQRGEQTAFQLNGSFSGPIKLNSMFYNFAYTASRQSSPLQTLLNTSPLGLQASGVSSDSVNRTRGVLDGFGIPTTAGRSLRNTVGQSYGFSGVFDFYPLSSTTGAQYGISFNGSVRENTPTGGGNTSFPSSFGESGSSQFGAQARHTAYLASIFLSETSIAASTSKNTGENYVAMPLGTVRVNSAFADGGSGVTTLRFGGNPDDPAFSTSNSASLLNSLSWFSTNNKHRLKFTTELNYSDSHSERFSNKYGTWNFNSISDLENGVPSSFRRTLTNKIDEASSLSGALSLGDTYRVNPDLQLQYGVRVDGGSHLNRPEFNPLVEQTFGVRNDFVPSRVRVSPRIGFSYTLGTAPILSAFEGAVRGPRAVVQGGVSLQQNGLGNISSVVNSTGLPSAIQTINCVGVAAPIPQWDLYVNNPDAIPDQCADGTAGTVFSNSSPSVSLYSRDFDTPKSLRTNLSWRGPIFDARFMLNLSGTHSLNMSRGSRIDLNFDPTVRFTLAEEGGRPVYVFPTSIVPGTGAIASRDARISQSFSSVNELRSDLRSETIQLQASLSPMRVAPGAVSWNATYIWQDVREQQRGFGGTTVGNPLDVYWSRGANTSRHQISANLGYTFARLITLSVRPQLRSGRPYTPTISGDVNGDGSSNDRPFIFNPATVSDPELATSMQSLLDKTSPDARRCLQKQMGNFAARNSCEGPWIFTTSVGITLNNQRLRLPNKAVVDISVENPLGGADLLFNGSRSPKGWGMDNSAQLDPTLLYVRGFDPNTGAYRYEVNQRFGSQIDNARARNISSGIRLQVTMDLGPVRERQDLARNLARGRTAEGTRYPETSLRTIGSAAVANPITQLMRLQDSLRLSADQADSIATLNRTYTVRLDSVWAVAAKHLANLPNEFDQDEAWHRYLEARRSGVDLMIEIAPTLKTLLTGAQKRKLPINMLNSLDVGVLNFLRNGTALYRGRGGGSISGMGGRVGLIGGEMVIAR